MLWRNKQLLREHLVLQLLSNTRALPPLFSTLASTLLFTETAHLFDCLFALYQPVWTTCYSSSHGAREGKSISRLPGICLSSLSQDLLFGNGELKGEVACRIQNDPHVTHSCSAKHTSAGNNLKTNLQGTQCAPPQRKMAQAASVSLLSWTKSGWEPEAKCLQIKSCLRGTKHLASCNHPAFNFITDTIGLAKEKSKWSWEEALAQEEHLA